MRTDSPGQVDGTLTVREEENAYLVVIEDDEADWLVRFEKAPDFTAREWALNMAHTYNGRRANDNTEGARWAARAPEIPISGAR